MAASWTAPDAEPRLFPMGSTAGGQGPRRRCEVRPLVDDLHATALEKLETGRGEHVLDHPGAPGVTLLKRCRNLLGWRELADLHEQGQQAKSLGRAPERHAEKPTWPEHSVRFRQSAVESLPDAVETRRYVERASSKGRASMSPRRKSPAGVLARAIASRGSDASKPATVAPRSSARWAANPDPHAMSNRRTPSPTFSRSNSRSFAGRAYGSTR